MDYPQLFIPYTSAIITVVKEDGKFCLFASSRNQWVGCKVSSQAAERNILSF
jgi:hypothetical protein